MTNPMGDIFNLVYGWYQRIIYDHKLNHSIDNDQYDIKNVPRWAIQVGHDQFHFYNEPWLDAWIAKEGLDKSLCLTQKVSAISPEIIPVLVTKYASDWTFPEDRGALWLYIERTHPDSVNDVAEWFCKTPCARTACSLLELGFSTNNTVAANKVYEWIQQDIKRFINVDTLGAVGHSASPERQCLFSRMVEHGAALQWFLEQRLDLTHMLLAPELWDAINTSFLRNGRIKWPAVSHRLFKKSPAPNDPRWQGIHLDDVSSNIAHYYDHDPAAQCYLIYRGSTARSSNANSVLARFRRELRYPKENTSPLSSTPESILLDTQIQALVLAANLGMPSGEFYQYATNIFNTTTQFVEPMLELPPTFSDV